MSPWGVQVGAGPLQGPRKGPVTQLSHFVTLLSLSPGTRGVLRFALWAL